MQREAGLRWPLDRYRTAMLLAACAAACFAMWNARHQYFIYDEWIYWSWRDALLDQGRLLQYLNEPHVGHWHGIVMLTWIPLRALFGAREYLPYVVPTVIAHVVAGVALFELLVWARIRRPISLAVAVLYLFSASAAANVSFGWQLVFTTPIACAFLGLLFVERYSDSANRWFGLAAVLAALTAVFSSGVGLTTTGVIVIAALLRRRLGLSAAVLGVAGGVHVLWRLKYEPGGGAVRLSLLGDYAEYARRGLEGAVSQILSIEVGVGAVVLLVGALFAIWSRRSTPSAGVFVACLLGSGAFYLSLATQRVGADESAFGPLAGRYVHVAVALLLPLLALVIDRVVDQWRWLAIPIALALVLTIAVNARDFVQFNDDYVAISERVRDDLEVTVAMRHHLRDEPGSILPTDPAAFWMDLNAIWRLADEGMLACDPDPRRAADVAGRLGLAPPKRSQLHC